jgi:integrase|tara:strand:+ start:2680 stop:4014 length:1335 start_codon:yes stop_codon:yes gene_type:complete
MFCEGRNVLMVLVLKIKFRVLFVSPLCGYGEEQIIMIERTHYSLDQLKELVQVGLISVPTKNDIASKPEMPYPSDIVNHNSGELCMDGKIAYHMGRWKIDFRRKQVGHYITCDKRGDLFESEAHADRALNAIRYEVDEGIFKLEDYKKPKIKQWMFNVRFENFLKVGCSKKKTPWSPSYKNKIKQYGNKYFLPYFASMDIRQIEEENINSFFDNLPEKLSDKTKKNIINALRAFLLSFKKIRQRGLEFPDPIVNEKAITWIDHKTQNRILKHIPDYHQPIFRFMFMYGVRPGEARALMWNCVDTDKNLITIKRTYSYYQLRETTKGKRERILPLVPEIKEMFEELHLHRSTETNLVFINPNNNKGFHYGENGLPNIWNEAVKKANLPYIRLYNGSRHSCASQLYEAGASLDDLRELLGHTKEDMTKRYADASQQRLAKVIKMRA